MDAGTKLAKAMDDQGIDWQEAAAYREANTAEVNAIIKSGVLNRKTGGNVLICLDENFIDFRHMGVSDRVDLARDLESAA